MATSGTPLGINIPNFADIRQEYGFKNVYLGNVYSVPKKGKKIQYMSEADSALYVDNYEDNMLVDVALHELLGHGSGKNFMESDKGEYNFEFGKIMNPITNKPVKSFYKPGENFNNVFKKVKSAYEECRADSVAMYLCCWDEIMEILVPGKSKETYDEVRKCIWHGMLVGALRGLVYYNVELKKWG